MTSWTRGASFTAGLQPLPSWCLLPSILHEEVALRPWYTLSTISMGRKLWARREELTIYRGSQPSRQPCGGSRIACRWCHSGHSPRPRCPRSWGGPSSPPGWRLAAEPSVKKSPRRGSSVGWTSFEGSESGATLLTWVRSSSFSLFTPRHKAVGKIVVKK